MSAEPQIKVAHTPAPLNAPQGFVLTLRGENKLTIWSSVWYGRTPIGVGYPFQWVLERRSTGVRIRRVGAAPERIISDPVQDFAFDELYAEPTIALVSDSHQFARGARLSLEITPILDFEAMQHQITETGWIPQAIAETGISETQTDPLFKKSAVFFSSALLLAWLASLFIQTPKKDPDELIPAQFAKTLLSPMTKSTAGKTAASAGRAGGGQNLVMAFKSEAVKKTTKALLNAGATKALLNTSALLNSSATSNLVQKVFEGKGPRVGNAQGIDPNVLVPSGSSQIGFLGGKGKGKGGGSADYGTGRGAAVEGQGTSQIGLSTEGAGVSEGLTKDEVGLVIRKHLEEVRYCYESALLRTPGFEGKLLAAFIIGGEGKVKKSDTKESCGDTKLDRCITDRLMTWKFPKPRGGVDVGVSYPFIFKSLGN